MSAARTLTLFALACTGWAAGPAQAQPTQQQTPAAVAELPIGPRYLVGELQEQAVRRCLANNKEEWLHPYLAVGFTRLVVPAALDAKALAGRVVVVQGTPASPVPAPAVQHQAPCMPVQMRGDWVMGKHGIRMQRGQPTGHAAPGAFRATSVAPFEGLEVTRSDDNIVVTWRNALAAALPESALTVHYEGCYGKPGSRRVLRRLGTLEPGKAVTERFPVHLVDSPRPGRAAGRGRVHHAHSLQITSGAGVVAFAFDVRLRRWLDPAPTCPRER